MTRVFAVPFLVIALASASCGRSESVGNRPPDPTLSASAVVAAHSIARHQGWAETECLYLGGLPVVSTWEGRGEVALSAVCVRPPVRNIGGRRASARVAMGEVGP